jgi:hypothetical protein
VPPRKRGLRLSVVSLGSEWSGRSWRDSTIRALNRVGFEGEGERENEHRGSVVIPGPVEERFRHVDGSFV